MGNKRVFGEAGNLNELLVRNYSKIMEAAAKGSKAAEEVDPINLAYIAGRLDGATDAMILKRASA